MRTLLTLSIALLVSVAVACVPYTADASTRPCAKVYGTHGQKCIPNLHDLPHAPDWQRTVRRKRDALHMPHGMTDLHAYGCRGRALVQRYVKRWDAYTFRVPGTRRVLAAFDRTNGDWYTFGRSCVILAGWRA